MSHTEDDFECCPLGTQQKLARLEAATLWVLWHHQGGSSPIGQPLRDVLGIDRHAHLTEHQLAAAKGFAGPATYRTEWPREKQVGRCGDMAPRGRSHLTLTLDPDCDVQVTVWDQEHDTHGKRASVEFCTGLGGGKSGRTREALIALMCAIEADNAEQPSHAWPPIERKQPARMGSV